MLIQADKPINNSTNQDNSKATLLNLIQHV